MPREVSPTAASLMVVALGAFGLATLLSPAAATLAILFGVVCLAMSVNRSRANADREEHSRLTMFAILVIFSTLALAGPITMVVGSPPPWLIPTAGGAWLALGAAWLVWQRHTRVRRAIYALALVTTAVLGAVHIISASGVGFDVLWLHEAAADAMADGVSPYSDAVTVPNGAPFGDPFIVGYPYPPLTALYYGIGSWVGGDARWASLAAWLLTLAIVGARSLRNGDGGTPLGAMLVAAAIPAWPLVLTAAWTEPFSLALLAVAVALWNRPRSSGGAIGLFIASKQYLLAAVPLIAAARDGDRWKRALWAAIAFAVSFLPVLVWGIGDFIDAAVRFHLNAPPRPDGTSIVGLLDTLGVTWFPPLWLVVLAVVALGVFLGRQARDLMGWLAALGAVLGTALYLSAQAFPNYWFLIAGIAALGIGSSSEVSRPQPPRATHASAR